MENDKTSSRKYFEWLMNPLFGFIATRRNIVKRDIYPGSNQLNKHKMEQPQRDRTDFEKELEELINKHSKENGSDTPDFILAQYLDMCLMSYNVAVRKREEWYGRTSDKVQVSIPAPIG